MIANDALSQLSYSPNGSGNSKQAGRLQEAKPRNKKAFAMRRATKM